MFERSKQVSKTNPYSALEISLLTCTTKELCKKLYTFNGNIDIIVLVSKITPPLPVFNQKNIFTYGQSNISSNKTRKLNVIKI